MTLVCDTRDVCMEGSTGGEGSSEWPLNPPSTSTELYRDSLDETNAHADAFDWYYAELYLQHFHQLPLVPWNIPSVWGMADVIASYLHFQASSANIHGVAIIITRGTLQRWTRHMIILAEYNLLGSNSPTYGTIDPRVFHGMLPDRSDSLPGRLFTSYVPDIERNLNLPFGPEQVIAPVQVYHPPTLPNPLQHIPVQPTGPTVKRHRESPEVVRSTKRQNMYEAKHPVAPDGWVWVDPEGINNSTDYNPLAHDSLPIQCEVTPSALFTQDFNDPTNPFAFAPNVPGPAAVPSSTTYSVGQDQGSPCNGSVFVDTLAAAYVQATSSDASSTLVSSPNSGGELGDVSQPHVMDAETQQAAFASL